MTTTWGLWDNVDSCWLGDDSGPKLFSSDDVIKGKRRVAAQVLAVQMKWHWQRISVAEWREQTLQKKDEIAHQMTTERALNKGMNGAI